MEIDEIKYFKRMSNYQPGTIKNSLYRYQTEINYFTLQIRTIAKDTLSNETIPNHAKEKIEDLVDLIKKLKKEGLKNVTLG